MNEIYTVIALVKEYALEIAVGMAAIVLVVRVGLKLIGEAYYKCFPLPETKFGFRGKLVYVDDSPSVRALVSHRYELAAKPDFVFKTGWNRYAVIEYKSRKAAVKYSDICQMYAGVLAARSRWNVTVAYVVTGSETRRFECGSSRSVYQKIAKHHATAKKVKYLNQSQPIKPKKECGGCGYLHHCHPHLQ